MYCTYTTYLLKSWPTYKLSAAISDAYKYLSQYKFNFTYHMALIFFIYVSV